MERALKRMYILRVCKGNGYSVTGLDYLFNNCPMMSLFTYSIRVWGVAAYRKYLSQIDRLLSKDFRFGYIQQETSIQQVVKDRDLRLRRLFPPPKSKVLRSRSHAYKVPCVNAERFRPIANHGLK